jgi:hypothetical protein
MRRLISVLLLSLATVAVPVAAHQLAADTAGEVTAGTIIWPGGCPNC